MGASEVPRFSRSARQWRFARKLTLALLACGAALACEAIAGYDDVEPRRRDAKQDGAVTDVSLDGYQEAEDGRTEERDAPGSDASDGTLQDAPLDRDAGPCSVLTGNDACAGVPHFTAAQQIVDGV